LQQLRNTLDDENELKIKELVRNHKDALTVSQKGNEQI